MDIKDTKLVHEERRSKNCINSLWIDLVTVL
jgi:hypothetical protein